MTQTIKVLLLDDNQLIANGIESRLLKACETFFESNPIEIILTHLPIDASDISKSGSALENFLVRHQPDVLLLDRGFFNLVDPVLADLTELDHEKLYIRKDAKSVKVTEILAKVNFSKVKRFMGIIVYTYDEPNHHSEWYVNPSKIKQELRDIFRDRVNPEYIDIVLTNTDIYHLANIRLYDSNPKCIGEYMEQGKKTDFILYGLFMGEILYHRTVQIIALQRKSHKNLLQNRSLIKLWALFVILSALSIGGNALYALAIKMVNNDVSLLLLSVVFSLIFPWLILALKPELLIDLDDDRKK